MVSHVSALVMQDIPVWDGDLGTVHLTRLDGANGRAARASISTSAESTRTIWSKWKACA